MKKIAICEPSCKESSHESFNSAYLVALAEIFSDCELCFFAHSTHIEAMQKYISLRKIKLNNLSFKEIYFENSYLDNGAKKRYLTVVKTIAEYLKDQATKFVFCTSINPMFADLLSKSNFQVTCIIHGGLEEFSPDYIKRIKPKLNYRALISAFIHIRPRCILKTLDSFYTERRNFSKIKNLEFKKMIVNSNKSQFSFILNSEHIAHNLEKEIGKQSNIFCLPLFQLSPVTIPYKKHDLPKFAIFGYGADNNLLSNLVKYLKDNIDSEHDYEIKNIGMRHYNDISQNVHFIQYDKGFLTREDMEYLLADVDILLNFYSSNEYKFGCSGSIIEAITYERPVIYTSNDTYNAFNNNYKIGIECKSMEVMCKTVQNIILDWNKFKETEFLFYKNNIKKEKEYLNLANSKNRLIEIFSHIGVLSSN